MSKAHRRVLVTGAAGFIGSHLTERLLQEGYSVRAFLRYTSSSSLGNLAALASNHSNLELHFGDICDPSRVRTAVNGCSKIFHLAALIGIPYSYHAPSSYLSTNISGTYNLLEAAKEYGIDRFIQTSTSEVYGSAQMVPITEEHRLRAQSPYAASKIASDQLALSYHASYDLPVLVLRPFNTYGPRQSLRAVIPAIIAQLLLKNNHIELGATDPTRDFCFVEDTVSGFIAASEAKVDFGQVFNVGTGYEISVGDVAYLIMDIVGRKVKIEMGQERVRPPSSEVNRLVCDSSLARTLLGWKPRYSGEAGLRAGLQKTIEWLSLQNNLLEGFSI